MYATTVPAKIATKMYKHCSYVRSSGYALVCVASGPLGDALADRTNMNATVSVTHEQSFYSTNYDVFHKL
eukprot:5392-Heterococcus_DN1.PRE.2